MYALNAWYFDKLINLNEQWIGIKQIEQSSTGAIICVLGEGEGSFLALYMSVSLSQALSMVGKVRIEKTSVKNVSPLGTPPPTFSLDAACLIFAVPF